MKLHLLKSYLAVVIKSVDSRMFQTLYYSVNGEISDVLCGGNLSCAFYVTAILKIFGLARDIQITVHRTLKDMRSRGWYEIAERRAGCIVEYKEKPADFLVERDPEMHSDMVKHLGIYIGEDTVVTNLDALKRPGFMPYDYRPIAKFYWHPKLGF